MNKTGALIIGGDYQGLGIARSLYRENIPVCVIDNDFSISRFSKCLKYYFKCPPARKEEYFVKFLLDISNRGLKGWVIFPTSDYSLSVLSRYKSQLANFYRIPTPSWDITKYFYDKRYTYNLAKKIGIDLPKTWISASPEEIEKLEFPYPVIIKPAILDNFYPYTKRKIFLARDKDELLRVYGKAIRIIDPSEVIVQEVIPGKPEFLFSLAAFFKDGKLKARLVAKRPRQHPMDFGHASTFVETVDIPELEREGEKLLKAAGYYGLAEVEFKFDLRDRKFKLLEVNPRTWGWHSIGLRAGVNFSFILYKDMLGEEIEEDPYRSGVKWIRVITDLPIAIGELIKGNLKLNVLMNSLKGEKEFAVFSWSDPLPFIAEFFLLPYLWRKRGF